MDLAAFDKHYDASTHSYDSEIRSRARQEAGTQLKFNLRLECFEQAPVDVEGWRETQYTLFGERPIFKNPDDLADMDNIAQAFDVALSVAVE
jgi:hypothetical protein